MWAVARRQDKLLLSPGVRMELHEDHIAELKERLRSLGLRATGSRVAVLSELHEQGRPMTQAEVMARLGPGFDGATVYRVLSDLAEIGLLRRLDLGDKVWRFELDDVCRGVAIDHPHFMCESCQTVTCLPELVLRTRDGAVPEALVGAELTVRISGRCRTCAAA